MTREDLGRDAHLLAALRHAPDREARPSPALSAAILAQARAAARQAAPPARASGSLWRAVLDRWVGRPHLAAAFGSVVVAALVGVLWSVHEPPVPAGPTAAVEPLAVATPPAAPAAPPASAPAAVPSPSAEMKARAGAAQQNAAAAERTERARAAAKAEAARRPDAAGSASAAAALPVPAPAPAPAAAAKQDTASAEAAAPTAAAPAAPSPPPAAARPYAAPPLPSPAAPPMADESRRARQERSAPAALSLADSGLAFDPLRALEAGGMDAWVWSASGVSGERAHGEAQRALWTALQQATQGRWQAVLATQPLAPWLLLRHGSQGAVLWLMGGALYVSDAQGRTWRAPVSAEQARDWQQAVGRW